MTAPGDSLEFQEPAPVHRFLKGLPEVREAVVEIVANHPHRLKVFGRVRRGEVQVQGQLYTFLLLRHHANKISLLTVVHGELPAEVQRYFLERFS